MQLAAAPMQGYPNETADYWAKKQEIAANQQALTKLQGEIDQVDE